MNREGEEAAASLLESSGNNFFEQLEEHLQTKIPISIKNILLVNDIDRALLLASFNKEFYHTPRAIHEIRFFRRNVD